MPVEIAPSEEAMQALVDRINSGSAYALEVAATSTDKIDESIEELAALAVDVATEEEQQLNETLAVTDRTSHAIRVWIRKKLDQVTPDEVASLKLVARQIFQQINNFDSPDGRVRVWECSYDPTEVPSKDALNTLGLFQATILLRVEVEAS